MKSHAIGAIFLVLAMVSCDRQQASQNKAESKLPLVHVAARTRATPSPLVAVMLTGDGGWAKLMRTVADEFSRAGVPTVALRSNAYFWHAPSAESAARDLAQLIQESLAREHRKKVLLIGYSRGAVVLPFLLTRITTATRERIALAVMIGLTRKANLDIKPGDYLLGLGVTDKLDVPAELAHCTGVPLLCIYGSEEADSPAPELRAPIQVLELSGGHHFGGNYRNLARVILVKAAEVNQ